jgi:hypothetical protein
MPFECDNFSSGHEANLKSPATSMIQVISAMRIGQRSNKGVDVVFHEAALGSIRSVADL